MSFYGDITNTARTTFQFDRIYSNRVEMEENKSQDGIYAGRFVLIEYDSTHLDSFLRVYQENNLFYSNKDCTIETLLTKGNTPNGTIVYTSTLETAITNGYFAKDCIFYRCTSTIENNNEDILNEPAEFEQIEDITQSNYLYNYQIDKEIYNRGYDSTVWQKIYSSGVEKYIMIAELNTTVPVLDITADAPTQSPVAPHFDKDSSNIYYKMHIQPSWGMRVKSASLAAGPVFNKGQQDENNFIAYSTDQNEIIRSDETTLWKREEYNPNTGEITTLYWHPSLNTWEETPPEGQENQLRAAIYYNEAGFNPEEISLDEIENHITIEPTGVSGQLYNQHNGNINELAPAPDIQEISIMLPDIGNSIAKMWNIVYGDNDINGNTGKRNTDIAWNSLNGLRMVEESEDGLSYNTDKVETLAGAINSVHDLMGMIIEDTSGGGSFEDEHYNKIFAATANDNKIYYNNGKYYRRALGYDYTAAYGNVEDEEYKNLPSTILPEDLDYVRADSNFVDFPAGDYYYADNDKITYTKELNNYPTLGRRYYANKNNEEDPLFVEAGVLTVYIKGTYYRQDGNNYITDDEPINGQEYYTLIEGFPVGQPYVKNQFYLYDGGKKLENNFTLNDIITKLKLSEGNFDENSFYYAVNITDGEIHIHEITLFELNDSIYYKNNGNYYACINGVIPDNVDTYYTLSRNEGPFTDFFSDNITYYTYSNNVYTKAENYSEGTVYHRKLEEQEIQIVADNPKDSRFYISNTYYYFDEPSQQYVLDTSLSRDNTKNYFIRGITLYVLLDKNKTYGTGAMWNSKITTVPSGIVLAKRSEHMIMKELFGFAKELSTIHGLILKINNLLLVGDIHTRDPETVQGTINQLKDIIARFEIIMPGNIMITDDYGRIHGASYEGDEWIDIHVDSNVLTPKVKITHEYNPETPPALTIINPNTNTDINSVMLETIKIDDAGHVVYKTNSEVVLPVTFKQISANNDIDNIIEANNCRDNFNVNGDNVISVDIDSEDSSINLTHNKIEETSTESTVDITESADEIQVENVYANEYGHINRREIIKYNLSNIYKHLTDIDASIDNIDNSIIDINESITSTQSAITNQYFALKEYRTTVNDILSSILSNLAIINEELNIVETLPDLSIPDFEEPNFGTLEPENTVVTLAPDEEGNTYIYKNGVTPLTYTGYSYTTNQEYVDLIGMAENTGSVLYLQSPATGEYPSSIFLTVLQTSNFNLPTDQSNYRLFIEFEEYTFKGQTFSIAIFNDNNEILWSDSISPALITTNNIAYSATAIYPAQLGENLHMELALNNNDGEIAKIKNLWLQ